MIDIKEIWIEAEEWVEGEWNYENDNTDVIVTLTNGERYIGSFFTYSNICTLTDKNMKTGENLSGKYLWASDMILIDRCSRTDIEKVIYELMEQGELTSIFSKIEKDSV
ncbi:hypothetical protein QQ008_06515 [Fulvivirgaceae bacterium BMA10]|uniref:Phage protein n=1 Tax=Splendidivirga corallicola TaxID=3051826 RepID=A0ABT8KMS7_9BACT|nr:hypothetical protein [Fulvivirgaceae bacterium BMA10]